MNRSVETAKIASITGAFSPAHLRQTVTPDMLRGVERITLVGADEEYMGAVVGKALIDGLAGETARAVPLEVRASRGGRVLPGQEHDAPWLHLDTRQHLICDLTRLSAQRIPARDVGRELFACAAAAGASFSLGLLACEAKGSIEPGGAAARHRQFVESIRRFEESGAARSTPSVARLIKTLAGLPGNSRPAPLTKQHIAGYIEQFVGNSPLNIISADVALVPEMIGMRIFDAPIVGFGAADDPLFDSFRSPEIIGAHYIPPREWLACGKTVISVFLPFTERVRAANRQNFTWPAHEWLHARIEGQALIGELTRALVKFLEGHGAKTVVPLQDPRFRVGDAPYPGDPDFRYGSTANWSERHAAFVCGLGTFSLNTALITRRGMAGRLGSVVAAIELPPDERHYTRHDEYCTHCGACIKHCPMGAITAEGGRSRSLCGRMVMDTNLKHVTYYGCGKCQVAVPCESGIPKRTLADR